MSESFDLERAFKWICCAALLFFAIWVWNDRGDFPGATTSAVLITAYCVNLSVLLWRRDALSDDEDRSKMFNPLRDDLMRRLSEKPVLRPIFALRKEHVKRLLLFVFVIGLIWLSAGLVLVSSLPHSARAHGWLDAFITGPDVVGKFLQILVLAGLSADNVLWLAWWLHGKFADLRGGAN